MEEYSLQNGQHVPCLGYGTGVVNHYWRNPRLWAANKARLVLSSGKHLQLNRQLKIDLSAHKMVRQAYDSGFRLFDTGRIYGCSEKAIGKGLAGIPRETYYITTKFSDLCFTMAPLEGYSADDVIGHLKKSLYFLKTEYVDLLLIHHPHGPVAEIWAQMETAYKQGLCRAIGTSNFDVKDFQNLAKTQTIAPMVNQGERHPFFQNNAVFDYCKEHGILFMAHTATGHAKSAQNYMLKNIAEKYGKTVQQIVLRWHYQNRVVPIISTASEQHIRESAGIFDFQLTADEMVQINRLEDGVRLLDCQNGVDNPNYCYNI